MHAAPGDIHSPRVAPSAARRSPPSPPVRREGLPLVTVADIVRHARTSPATPSTTTSPPRRTASSPPRVYAVEEALRRVVEAAARSRAGRPASTLASAPSSATWPTSRPWPAPASSRRSLPGPPRWTATRARCQAFVPLFRMGRKVSPHGEELPGTLEETIVGGVFWIVYQRVVGGQVEQIEGAAAGAGRVRPDPVHRRRGGQADSCRRAPRQPRLSTAKARIRSTGIVGLWPSTPPTLRSRPRPSTRPSSPASRPDATGCRASSSPTISVSG